MPQRTDRQMAADLALSDAIEEHRDAYLDSVDQQHSETLAEYVVLACFVHQDKDGDLNALQHFAMPDGYLLPHRLRGLLQEALHILDQHCGD